MTSNTSPTPIPTQDPSESREPRIERRQLLKFSAVTSLVLGAAGLGLSLSGCSQEQSSSAGELRYLRIADRAFFSAMVPVVLGPLLLTPGGKHVEQATLDEVIRTIDTALYRANSQAQKQFYQFLDLINTGLGRRLIAGTSKHWTEMSDVELDAVLERWRSSRLNLLTTVYNNIRLLAIMSRMVHPDARAQTGYPGPWAPMYQAVNS